MQLFIAGGHVQTDLPKQQDFSMHTHDTHEIFCFLAGDADYSVEGNRYSLQHGDVMLMRKSEAHHLILKSASKYERVIINFDIPNIAELDPENRLLAPFNDRTLGKFNQYKASLFPGNQWQYYINKLCDCATPHQKLCYLLPLLSELAECFETVRTSHPGAEKDRAAAVIKYINRNLCTELSLSSLAEQFYLSKTHLNRIFKQSTGSTVWDYIIVKRLFLARELIHTGEPPTRVCLQCGFKDYTTFYRAYKQHFGTAPRKDFQMQ